MLAVLTLSFPLPPVCYCTEKELNDVYGGPPCAIRRAAPNPGYVWMYNCGVPGLELEWWIIDGCVIGPML